MTDATMLITGTERMQRILSAVYECNGDLRISKNESNSAAADAENTE
jgi:hypothetical protein